MRALTSFPARRRRYEGDGLLCQRQILAIFGRIPAHDESPLPHRALAHYKKRGGTLRDEALDARFRELEDESGRSAETEDLFANDEGRMIRRLLGADTRQALEQTKKR